MRIRFMSQAQQEVFEATAYYLKQSKEAADRFVLDLGDTTSLLLQFPRAGSQIEGEVRRIILKNYPYQLVYRVEGDEIRIYAVAHLKRRPNYWTGRL